MKFALLIWSDSGGWGTSAAHRDILDHYLTRIRDDGNQAELQWFAPSQTALWTDGEPHDAVLKNRGPRPPSFDPIEIYRAEELIGLLTLDCADEDVALEWASKFPFILSVEVRRIDNGGQYEALDSARATRELARGRWLDPQSVAADRVAKIIQDRPDLVPSLLRAFADTAPVGQLPMIGVRELEDLSMDAERAGVEDPTLDLLIAAQIPPAALMEILSGPWPHFLEQWQASERLRGILSDEQCAELEARYRKPSVADHSSEARDRYAGLLDRLAAGPDDSASPAP